MRHARFAECLARIVHAEVLRASAGASENAEAEQELDRAEELVRDTGVVIFAPFIRSARTKLASIGKSSGETFMVG